ncbi:tyrosine-protein phosphatase [Pseudonocardia phyllosphaerae]|uniref:tyrosine-protein phosphatase n=1 Tax=Pseudonocardia phyllosphaerae TaxID=3390502 RepID=UPI00397BE937
MISTSPQQPRRYHVPIHTKRSRRQRRYSPCELAPGVNARGLGGTSLGDLGVIRSKTLLRCASLTVAIAPAVRKWASAAGGIHLIDLRDLDEIESGASHTCGLRGLTVHRFTLKDPATPRPLARDRDLDYFRREYATMLLPAQHIAAYAVSLLATTDLPVAITCQLGKDRTGVVVMALQHLLGVPHEQIIDEFDRTAQWFADHPEWVNRYACLRSEDPVAVRQRVMLPRQIGEQAAARLLSETPAVDPATRFRALRRVSSSMVIR